MTNETYVPSTRVRIITRVLLAATIVLLIGAATYGFVDIGAEAKLFNKVGAFICIVTGLAGSFGFTIILASDLISDRLKARPAIQIIPKKDLFSTSLHTSLLPRRKKVWEPHLHSDTILLAFKIWRLSHWKSKVNDAGEVFKGVIRLKYRREMGDAWFGGKDELIPISYEEMSDIQKDILDNYISKSTLVPLNFVVKSHKLSDQWLAHMFNKYTIELYVT